jgi:hypothetical protein
LFIHNSGRCDAIYEKVHGKHLNVKDGEDLPTDFKTTTAAITAIMKLVKSIDHALLNGRFIPQRVAGT